MFNYIVRRVALGLLTLLLISFLVYALIRHIPGTPLTTDPAMMNPGKIPSKVDIQRWEKLYGLDKPWFVSGFENLKSTALIESPLNFRKRNIFVLGNFLTRV